MTTAYQIFQLPRATQIDSSVRVVPGCKAYFYVTGTSTPQDTYTDAALTTPSTNPVVADANGVFAPIYLDSSKFYKLTLTTAADVLIYTVDPCNDQIPDISAATGASLVGNKYDATGSTYLNLHSYIEDDGAYNAMGFVPEGLKAAIRARSSTVDMRPYLITALAASISSGSSLFIPAGLWNVDGFITVTGAAKIYGVRSGSYAEQSTVLNHVATNSTLWLADSVEFGGWYLGHMQIMGGSGDGSPCILSRRNQSLIEFISMQSSIGYNNPGIKLEDIGTNTTSFGTNIENCKWVGPQSAPGVATPCNFIGYDIKINGGGNVLRKCIAILGDIGIDIKQGQAITILDCGTNLQTAASSTNTAADGQCGIRFSGTLSGGGSVNYKAACSIIGSYIEACTNHIKIVSCESLTIADNEIQGLGFATQPVITIEPGDARNVTIRNNQISSSVAAGIGILASSDNNLKVENNYFDLSGAGAFWMSVTQRVDYGYNTILAGTLDDPSGLAYDIKPEAGSWTGTLTGCTTVPTPTVTWTRSDRTVTLKLPTSTGVSNTNACTITGLPTALLPKTLQRVICRIVDNSITAFGLIQIDPGAPGVLTLGVGPTFAAMTAANNKGTSVCDVTYSLD